MAYMEKLREGTLAGAIEKFALQSRQQSASDGEDGWDHTNTAPGHTLRDFLHDSRLTPPPASSSPPPLRETAEMYGPQNRRQEQTLGDRKAAPICVPGVCGLLNMGNTCYMNAGLQCIRSIPEIAHHYLNVEARENEQENEQATKSHKGHLSSRMSTLLCKLWSGVYSAVHPQAFKTTLGVLHPQFSGSRQQDCQEFLAMLLDSLHEDFLPVKSPDRPLEKVSNQIAASESCDHESTNENAGETKKSDDVVEKTSVVTQTFRGMLRNEVVCHKCRHQSTKEEPFFYLSVPLPHAFERQIYVQWMPVSNHPGTRQSIRLLVTVLKVVTIAVLKDAIVDLIGRPLSHDLIQIAETSDNCIVRLLADTVAVKQIDDEKCRLFAYELASLPGPAHPPPPPHTTTSHPSPSSSTSSKTPVTNSSSSERERKDTHDSSISGRKHSKGSDSETEGLPTKMFKSELQSPTRKVGNFSSAPVVDPPNDTPDSDKTAGIGGGGEKEDVPVVSQASAAAVVVEWHSCAICLEEMVDSDLVTHASCGAVLCPTCLQSSVDHYQKEDGLVPCPICLAVVKSSEAFTPLAQPSTTTNVRKLLQTTVLFRDVSTDGSARCTAPPAILRLPESATSGGTEYYDAVSPLLPPSLAHSDQWSLSLTDSKGRFCSRCLYGSGCHGCVIARSSPHSLRPGDYLSVTVEREGGCEGEMCEEVETHPSLATKRDSNLTLEECLEVFSQREELVGDNHWLCPSCNDFQPASRVLSVSTLPNTLIIHLKRFVYHGTTGSKVDAPVSFPLELDPRLVSHDCHMTDPLELAACVCHFGSLNCGHYTAYVRHMTSGQWSYCNDETVTEGSPSEKDSGSVYILFYRRKDLPVLSLPTITKTFDDEAEMSSVTQLLRQHKPHPSDSRPPPLPRRSNSIGDLRPSQSIKKPDSITTEANSLLASLGINPHSATIAHTLLPQASPIIQAESIPHSPPPPTTPSSLLTPPPSNSSSFTQTTPIVEDYMNYDFSDEVLPSGDVVSSI